MEKDKEVVQLWVRAAKVVALYVSSYSYKTEASDLVRWFFGSGTFVVYFSGVGLL